MDLGGETLGGGAVHGGGEDLPAVGAVGVRDGFKCWAFAGAGSAGEVGPARAGADRLDGCSLLVVERTAFAKVGAGGVNRGGDRLGG